MVHRGMGGYDGSLQTPNDHCVYDIASYVAALCNWQCIVEVHPATSTLAWFTPTLGQASHLDAGVTGPLQLVQELAGAGLPSHAL